MKVLLEGIGSMVFGAQLKYYNQLDWELVGIDINNKSFGLYSNVKPYIVPKYNDPNCFKKIEDIIVKENVDLVFPTVNEGLLEWSKRKKYFKEKYDTEVIISDEKIIEICVDKWRTYLFFKENNIPTPETSLNFKYELLKPRVGRGSIGIYKKSEIKDKFSMKGYISQELINGKEYTIDVLCNFDSNPVYIIPRERKGVESGVSVIGKTFYDKKIIDYTKEIIHKLKPIGIINLQCFKQDEEIYFIEINPRIAGGSSLSFASSDNWFKVIETLLKKERYEPRKVVYNNYMFRYYSDIIVNEKDLIK